MKTDLRLTDTNAASDSKGRTWGLEGGTFSGGSWAASARASRCSVSAC